MNVHSECREWIIRQAFACVHVRASSAPAPVEDAARRLGSPGGWQVDPDIDQEVFRVVVISYHSRHVRT